MEKEKIEQAEKEGKLVLPKPQRRGVVKRVNVEIPGFDAKEMIELANKGKQGEYFAEKFKLNRKRAY